MINSFRSTAKNLRLLNITNVVKSITERKPIAIVDIPKCKNEIISNADILSFAPRSIGVKISEQPLISKVKQDPIPYVPIVNPRSILPLIDSQWRKDEIGLPSVRQDEIQAARLIVIRKKKMRKHQRKKLWKKMRYRWARIKQRRRQVKEKIFQKELLALIKQANEFSAEAYVSDKIQRANHTPLPTRWRHKRLPEFIIRQLLGIDKKINYSHSDIYKA